MELAAIHLTLVLAAVLIALVANYFFRRWQEEERKRREAEADREWWVTTIAAGVAAVGAFAALMAEVSAPRRRSLNERADRGSASGYVQEPLSSKPKPTQQERDHHANQLNPNSKAFAADLKNREKQKQQNELKLH